MAKKTSFEELSIDTQLLIDRLRKAEVGESVSYTSLTEIIKRNVQMEARHVLNSARKILQREDHALFGTIRGEGLKRLADVEIANSGGRYLKQVNHTAKRGVRALGCVSDFAKLPLQEQIRHNAALSLLGCFYEVSKSQSRGRIEAAVAIMQKKLPFKETLGAFLTA